MVEKWPSGFQKLVIPNFFSFPLMYHNICFNHLPNNTVYAIILNLSWLIMMYKTVSMSNVPSINVNNPKLFKAKARPPTIKYKNKLKQGIEQLANLSRNIIKTEGIFT